MWELWCKQFLNLMEALHAHDNVCFHRGLNMMNLCLNEGSNMIDMCSNQGSNIAITQSLDLFVQPTQIHSRRLSKPSLHFGQQLVLSNISMIHALTTISFQWSFNFLIRVAEGGSRCSKSPPKILGVHKAWVTKVHSFFFRSLESTQLCAPFVVFEVLYQFPIHVVIEVPIRLNRGPN